MTKSFWFLIHTAAGAHPSDPQTQKPPGPKLPGKAGEADPEENTRKTEFQAALVQESHEISGVPSIPSGAGEWVSKMDHSQHI